MEKRWLSAAAAIVPVRVATMEFPWETVSVNETDLAVSQLGLLLAQKT